MRRKQWYYLAGLLAVAGLLALDSVAYFIGEPGPTQNGQPGFRLPAGRNKVERQVYALLPQAEQESQHFGCCMTTRPATDKIVALGDQAVPALLVLLQPDQACDSATVIRILGMMGPRAQAAVSELKRIALLPHADFDLLQSDALQALEKIIPGDPSLITLAGQMAAQGQRQAAEWLADQGRPAHQELLRLVRAAQPPSLDLLKCYARSGAPLIDIAPNLLRAMKPDDPGQLAQLSSCDQDKLREDNRWAAQVLDSRPDERRAVLALWAKNEAGLNDGARTYLLQHLADVYGTGDKRMKVLLQSIERDHNYDAIHELIHYGNEGVAELRRLAVFGSYSESRAATNTLSNNPDTVGPEVYAILYDAYRQNERGDKMGLMSALFEITVFPEAYHAMVLQAGQDLATAPEEQQTDLLNIYVTGTYGKGQRVWERDIDSPEDICRDALGVAGWFKQASERDASACVRQLAAALYAKRIESHRENCDNPACPEK